MFKQCEDAGEQVEIVRGFADGSGDCENAFAHAERERADDCAEADDDASGFNPDERCDEPPEQRCRHEHGENERAAAKCVGEVLRQARWPTQSEVLG